jgi:hypothetical protein
MEFGNRNDDEALDAVLLGTGLERVLKVAGVFNSFGYVS